MQYIIPVPQNILQLFVNLTNILFVRNKVSYCTAYFLNIIKYTSFVVHKLPTIQKF